MKPLLLKLFCISTALFLVNSSSFAQKKKRHHHQMQALNTYTGKVTSFTANPDKVYDAFQMDVNGTPTRVKFPKHLGTQIMAAAKPGMKVTVNGFMDYNKQGSPEIHFVNLTAGSKVIYKVKKPKKVPNQEEFVTVKSTVRDFKRNREGVIDGLYLNDATILKFPKHISNQVTSMLKAGDPIWASGYVKPKSEGVAYAEKVRIVKAETIRLNGTTYLLK